MHCSNSMEQLSQKKNAREVPMPPSTNFRAPSEHLEEKGKKIKINQRNAVKIQNYPDPCGPPENPASNPPPPSLLFCIFLLIFLLSSLFFLSFVPYFILFFPLFSTFFFWIDLYQRSFLAFSLIKHFTMIKLLLKYHNSY